MVQGCGWLMVEEEVGVVRVRAEEHMHMRMARDMVEGMFCPAGAGGKVSDV